MSDVKANMSSVFIAFFWKLASCMASTKFSLSPGMPVPEWNAI